MAEALFFVPIRGQENKIVQLADDYCNLGDRVARVISKRGGRVFIRMETEAQSMLIVALKIASYIVLLGIPLLVACAIKAYSRHNVEYVVSPLSMLLGQQQPENSTSELEGPESSATKIEDSAPAAEHPMEKVQKQLLAWWNEKDDKDDFKNRGNDCPIPQELVASLQQCAKEELACLNKEIVLVWVGFNWGFGFFYAHMPEGKKHLPLSRQVGCLLNRAKGKNIELPWLTIDPETGKQVIVRVQEMGTTKIAKAGGSMPTSDYLRGLLKTAKMDLQSEGFRILEALTPYAFNVKKELGADSYKELRTLIPTYPENPGIHLA